VHIQLTAGELGSLIVEIGDQLRITQHLGVVDAHAARVAQD
jgi:hypothetical protein